MENEIQYRLGKFILTEYSRDVLMWATNAAFGGQRSGQCFIVDNILVFLPWDCKAVGYLRLEFHITCQAIRDLGRRIGGTCIIESGILFLCPKEDKFAEGQSRAFYTELELLPSWDATRMWGHQEST